MLAYRSIQDNGPVYMIIHLLLLLLGGRLGLIFEYNSHVDKKLLHCYNPKLFIFISLC